MKHDYRLLTGIVFLILITLANLYSQDPFVKLEPSTSILGWSQGVCWGDYNNDGWQDAYVTNGQAGHKQGNLLYLNDGDGTFTQITSGAIVTDAVISAGATWGDYDNNGTLDLYVTSTADNTTDSKINFLYRNNGDGSFTKMTSAGPPVSDNEYSCAASWGDYDNDGYLDLFLKNGWYNKQPNSLYRSDGDGTFTDITGITLVSSASDVASFIAGCSWVDYDGDGDLDLFTCSGSGANTFLWRNDGDENFVKLALFDAGDSQACSWGDYDNDGDPDLFIANYGESETTPETNFLYRNDGSDTFVKITTGDFGTSAKFSQGSAWGDLDNDGDLDLYVGNDGNATTYPSDLYYNNGDGTFTKNTTSVAASDAGFIYGVAMADYNNDGFLDIFAAREGQNYLYKNVEPTNGNTNHWIKIKLIGMTSNKSGIGAQVRIRATINSVEKWQMREISGQTGYASQNSLIAHFGLGNATVVSEIRIEWPSGSDQTLFSVGADQLLTVTEGVSSESITVTSPNGGEAWEVASLQTITWTSSGVSSTVQLDYSIDNGSSWTPITASTANDGIYDWTIPDTPSDLCLVRVADTDGNPSDVSNSVFSIIAPGMIGDVNSDETPNSTDALIILSCDVGLDVTSFCPMDCGDVNNDGFINSTDALIILSYDVGLEIPYPVGESGCYSGVTPCPGCNP
ncbi:VCBS repeat-containing protein [candidate division KSB1 bacterium]|nr:VCBS repeat-containing protein [candidate division KSB1 bacterium]